MKPIVMTLMWSALLGAAVPAMAAETLLFETCEQSRFNPTHADEFIASHRPKYTDGYSSARGRRSG
jgi:hypothetical protein